MGNSTDRLVRESGGRFYWLPLFMTRCLEIICLSKWISMAFRGISSQKACCGIPRCHWHSFAKAFFVTKRVMKKNAHARDSKALVKNFVCHDFYYLRWDYLKYIEKKFAQKLWKPLFLYLVFTYVHIYRKLFRLTNSFPYPKASFKAIYRKNKNQNLQSPVFSIP